MSQSFSPGPNQIRRESASGSPLTTKSASLATGGDTKSPGGGAGVGGARRGSGMIPSPNGRRGSGSITTPSGQTVTYHTRTQDDLDYPHAEKKTIADHLRKYEALFTLSAQRMKMIVNAFEETLDKGLKKPDQVVPMSESSVV